MQRRAIARFACPKTPERIMCKFFRVRKLIAWGIVQYQCPILSARLGALFRLPIKQYEMVDSAPWRLKSVLKLPHLAPGAPCI